MKLAQSQMVVAKHAKTAARKINTNQQKNPKHHATPMRRRGTSSTSLFHQVFLYIQVSISCLAIQCAKQQKFIFLF